MGLRGVGWSGIAFGSVTWGMGAGGGGGGRHIHACTEEVP